MNDTTKPADVLQVQQWIDRVRQQVCEDNAERERTGQDEKFYTFTLNEMNHLLPLLSVAKASAIPEQSEGWKLVPLEPTPEMKEAALENAPLIIREHYTSNGKFTGTVSSMSNEMFGDAYKAMLAAAPQAEEVPAVPTVDEFLARLLPPPGYEGHKVIARDGKLMFCLPGDVLPTDGLCFYDGDMRAVAAPEDVQPSIDFTKLANDQDVNYWKAKFTAAEEKLASIRAALDKE